MTVLADDDAALIRNALECAVEARDEKCAESGCFCDLRGDWCSLVYRKALAVLNGTCRCDACLKSEFGPHASDCAVHNAPAAGSCTCWLAPTSG